MESKKNLDRPAVWLRILTVLCVLETILILCYCGVRAWRIIVRGEGTSYQVSDVNDIWSEEKLPFAKANSWYWEREALFMRFSDRPVDLVCLGDSITQKFEWQDAFPDLRVANRGIGSDTTEGMLARLDSVKAIQPSVISLMAGINDLLSRSPEDVAASYAFLLDALAEELPDAVVIVSSVLPVAAAHPIDNQNVRSLNAALEALCQERGLCYLDFYGEFAGDDGCLRPEYALDSVHLTPSGYALWLSYLVPAVDSMI